jgi:excinuclease ABC subunit C
MYEVLSRRFRRARQLIEAAEAAESASAARTADAGTDGRVDEIMAEVHGTDSPWQLPDLLVVDGGKGQLGMALAAARDVGIDVRAGVGLPIIALAKERDAAEPASLVEDDGAPGAATGPAGEPEDQVDTDLPELAVDAAVTPAPAPEPGVETAAPPPGGAASYTPSSNRSGAAKRPPTRNPDRVFLAHTKDAIPIRANSAEMFVLAHLRDEAHRFAVTFHRAQRKRRTLRSALSDIVGIGETRQRDLLRHFGSVRKIREASVEELLAVPGMGRKAALAVRDHFDSHPEPTPVVAVPRDRGSRLVVLDEASADATGADAAAEEEAVLAAFAATDDEPEAD